MQDIEILSNEDHDALVKNLHDEIGAIVDRDVWRTLSKEQVRILDGMFREGVGPELRNVGAQINRGIETHDVKSDCAPDYSHCTYCVGAARSCCENDAGRNMCFGAWTCPVPPSDPDCVHQADGCPCYRG